MADDVRNDDALPEALRSLWRAPGRARRPQGLSRDRIVAAAIELADAEGLARLSMARLAERLGCGTMSLYRHVANKAELLNFMLATAPGPPPPPSDSSDSSDWRAALTQWAAGLWEVYHRHPWILDAATAGPPLDPGQLAWLEAGLSALAPTALGEPDKLSAVMALLHYMRGAAALEIASTANTFDRSRYRSILRQVIDPDRFPAIAKALAGGAFGDASDRTADMAAGVRRLLDGIEAQARRS